MCRCRDLYIIYSNFAVYIYGKVGEKKSKLNARTTIKKYLTVLSSVIENIKKERNHLVKTGQPRM